MRTYRIRRLGVDCLLHRFFLLVFLGAFKQLFASNRENFCVRTIMDRPSILTIECPPLARVETDLHVVTTARLGLRNKMHLLHIPASCLYLESGAISGGLMPRLNSSHAADNSSQWISIQVLIHPACLRRNPFLWAHEPKAQSFSALRLLAMA